jgi:3-oxoacyl-[acyl-carrier protein] reductase
MTWPLTRPASWPFMSDNVVCVTGASKGIGLGLTAGLVDAGYTVVGVCRRPAEALTALCAETGRVEPFYADLATDVGVSALAEYLRFRPGLYGLVNNAAVAMSGLHALADRDGVDRMFALNVLAPLQLCQAATRAMMRSGRGRIVNISSLCTRRSYRGLAAYTATKAAIEGFSRVLATEVGAWGVTVNCVAPGFLETAMNAMLDESTRGRLRRRGVLPNALEVRDVMTAVRFLLSPDAASITGEVVRVDSGAAL